MQIPHEVPISHNIQHVVEAIHARAKHMGFAQEPVSFWKKLWGGSANAPKERVLEIHGGSLHIGEKMKNGRWIPFLIFTPTPNTAGHRWSIEWEGHVTRMYTIVDHKENMYVGPRVERLIAKPVVWSQLSEAHLTLYPFGSELGMA